MFVQQYTDIKAGAVDVSVASAAVMDTSPHTLTAAMFERTKTDAISLFLEVVGASRVWLIDSKTAFAGTSYCFPNAQVPAPISVAPGFHFRLRVVGTVDGAENQSVVLFVATMPY